jgi:hypothetical protein
MTDPPTLLSEALLNEKITKNGQKRQKITKTPKVAQKCPK